MPVLSLQFKNKSVGSYQLEKGTSLTIGRRDDNDVIIDDPAVSGHHAKIDSLGDRFVLIDLKSKNGTFVNEQLIDSHWLTNGDMVTIGDTENLGGNANLNRSLIHFFRPENVCIVGAVHEVERRFACVN